MVRKSSSGFTALEGVIGLMFLCSLLVMGARQINQQIDRQTEQAVAEQLVEVARCVRRYVADNYSHLLSAADQPKEEILDIKDVIDKGYLASSFPSIDRKHKLKNLFGQKYIVHIRLKNFRDEQDNEIKDRRQLQILLLTSGGSSIQDGSLLRIVRAAGASAGWVKRLSLDELRALGKLPAPGQPLLPVDKIIGLQHSWELGMPKKPNLADSQNPQNHEQTNITSAGHLAHLSYLSNSDILDSHAMLHRRQVPGDRALKMNSMETDLEMQDCDILFSSNEISPDLVSSSNNKKKWFLKAKLSAKYLAWPMDGAKPDKKTGDIASDVYLGTFWQDESGLDNGESTLFLRNSHNSMRATKDRVKFSIESVAAGNEREATSASSFDQIHSTSSGGDMKLLPTEMSRAWHKLPYSEFTLAQTNSSKDGKKADSQTITSALDKYATERCRGTNKEHPVGRMFLMGAEHRSEVALYICNSDFRDISGDRDVDGEVQASVIRLALLGEDGAVGK